MPETGYLKSVEAEYYVIGAIIKKPVILGTAHRVKVEAEWFTEPFTYSVWLAIEHLEHNNLHIEGSTIIDYLTEKDSAFDRKEIEHAKEICVNPGNALQHLMILKNKFQKRELQKVIEEQKHELESDKTAKDIITDFVIRISEINHTVEPLKNTEDIIKQRAELYRMGKARGSIGIPSRWVQINSVLGGYLKGKMHVIAGRPRQGKTMYACNEILYSAKEGYNVGVVSIEMKECEIRARMAADALDMDLDPFEQGTATLQDIDEHEKCMLTHASLPITFLTGASTYYDIRSFILDNPQLDTVWIDYFQRIQQHSKDPSGKVERLSNWSEGLTNAFTTADTAGCLISMINREELFDRNGKPVRPKLHHLKGTGNLEQDSEKVIFVYQQLKYGNEKFNTMAPSTIEIAKHRGGREDRIKMNFHKNRNKFLPEGVDSEDEF